MQTREILELLRKRYSGPAWAFAAEVGNATGSLQRRHADAVVMGLWPSRGLTLEAFEIKASRSDWLRELKDPAKAEAVAAHVDAFWVVATVDVVRLEEVPSKWGWLCVQGKRLVAKKRPAYDHAGDDRVSRAFVAAFARGCLDEGRALLRGPREELREEIRREEAELRKREEDRVAGVVERAADRERYLGERIKSFEERSGLKIDGFNGPRMGDIVRLLLTESWPDPLRSIANCLEGIEALVQAREQLRDLADVE